MFQSKTLIKKPLDAEGIFTFYLLIFLKTLLISHLTKDPISLMYKLLISINKANIFNLTILQSVTKIP